MLYGSTTQYGQDGASSSLAFIDFKVGPSLGPAPDGKAEAMLHTFH